MKTRLTFKTLVLLTGLSVSMFVGAEEITLPVISKPAILEEGTQRELTSAQIAELLPWAKDSKLFLTDLLENIQGLTTADKIERLIEGMSTVVGDSASKHSELLMRYSLNRGLVLADILTKEMDSLVVGSQDAKLRVLVSSIQMAIKYYETDMAILAKKSVAPYVLYGLDYFNFLSELNKSIFDATAQYHIQRTALEWLQWDLYRDLNNTSYAAQIVKINNGLRTFPNKRLSDSQSIANIRLMKKLAQQLSVKETLTKLEEEKRLSMAKNEEERKLMLAKTEAERQRVKQEAELEKMRGIRTEVEIEKVRIGLAALGSSSWETRLDAVNRLAGVIGGDVSLALMKRFMYEADADVGRALRGALETRLPNSLFLMKIESMDNFRKQIVASVDRPAGWERRMHVVQVLGHVPTIECYRLLSSWSETEKDSDVRSALVASMNKIEKVLK